MQKSFLAFVFISFFHLSSCAPAAAPAAPSIAPTAPTIIIPTPHPAEPACASLNLEPTPGPDVPSLFPPVSTADYSRGPDDAPVTILVYNDFQCTDCNYLPVAKQLLEQHPDDVRIVYRYYPYSTYFDKAELAAQAAEAAARQGKFWEMHDLLFEQQADWVDLPVEAFEGWVTVLDKAGNIVAQVGDNPNEKQRANYGLPPDQWQVGICNSPHGATMDKNGNLIVTEWSQFGHLHKFALAKQEQ